MDKIAIIGMSCLFPGAVTPSHLMRNLLDKKDLTSLISKGKLQADPDFFFADKKASLTNFIIKEAAISMILYLIRMVMLFLRMS